MFEIDSIENVSNTFFMVFFSNNQNFLYCMYLGITLTSAFHAYCFPVYDYKQYEFYEEEHHHPEICHFHRESDRPLLAQVTNQFYQYISVHQYYHS